MSQFDLECLDPVWSKDSLVVDVTIADEAAPGQPKDLTAATVVAVAQRVTGKDAAFSGTAQVLAPATDGKVRISFASGDFDGPGGDHEIQLRVTIGTETQTVKAFLVPVERAREVAP